MSGPVDTCEPNPCDFGGMCSAANAGGFSCSCQPDYFGERCESNPCSSMPCHAKITAYAHRLAPIVSLVCAQMGTLVTNVRIKNAIHPARLVILAGVLVALITLLYFFEVAGIKKKY